MNRKLMHTLPLLAASALPVVMNAQEKRPDVLFLFVDDMTFDGLNVLGTDDIISPHLDRLINSGVRFNNCYQMGGWNGAISTASRSQLLTGMYLWHTFDAKNTDKYASHFESQAFWPQVMKKAGYKTFHSGKWHLSHIGSQKLYEVAIHQRPGMPKTVEAAYNRPNFEEEEEWYPWDIQNGGYWEADGKHWSEILADDAINFMKENQDSQDPLFMVCAFNAPHDPRQSPKEFIDQYPLENIDLPQPFWPEHPMKDEMGNSKDKRDERLAPFPRTEYAVKKHRQEYYALITHLDQQVGRILQQLQESGRAENTLIVFAADNGLALGKHGFMGKQSMYDHSMKVPLAFIGQGLPQGEQRDQLVYLQDLVPTLYEMLGIDAPEEMEFCSQRAALEQDRKGRDAVYGAYMDYQRMVRMGDWKLFFILENKKAMLFNVKENPEETIDYLEKGGRKYKKIARKLAARYVELAEEAGDKTDIRPLFPEFFD